MTTYSGSKPGVLNALWRNFLGQSPEWYKMLIVGFLIINMVVYYSLGAAGPKIAGWMVVLEFIFTLAMALKCYPLLPGGLLAIQAAAIGLAKVKTVFHELLPI